MSYMYIYIYIYTFPNPQLASSSRQGGYKLGGDINWEAEKEE